MPVPPPPEAKRVFHGELIDVWQWDQERYDSSRATYECLTRQDATVIIGFLDPKTILLTRQEQPSRPIFLDVPGGRVEKDETHKAAVKRELLEETGFQVGKLKLYRSFDHKGIVRFSQSIFLGRDLTNHTERPALDAGEKIEILPTSWEDLVQMCMKRELRQTDIMLAVLTLEFSKEGRAFKEQFLS